MVCFRCELDTIKKYEHRDARSMLVCKARFLIVTIGAVVLFSVQSCLAKTVATVPVSVTKVTTTKYVPTFDVIGQLQSMRQVSLRADSQGHVEKILFKSGQLVTKGQAIVTVNRDKLRAIYQAELAHLRNEKLTFQRLTKLTKKGYVSKSTYDLAHVSYLKSLTATRIAEINLQNSTVRAPFDGRLGIRNVSVGDLVNSGNVIVSISSTGNYRVSFNVPQKYVHILKIGNKVSIITSLRPNDIYYGTVYAFNDRLAKGVAALSVLATISNKDHKLKSNASVSVKLYLSGAQRVMILPQSAILYSLYGTYVYRVINNHVVHTNIKLGDHLNDGSIVIKSGVTVGEVVVITGQYNLQNGYPVAIKSKISTMVQ